MLSILDMACSRYFLSCIEREVKRAERLDHRLQPAGPIKLALLPCCLVLFLFTSPTFFSRQPTVETLSAQYTQFHKGLCEE